MNSLLSRQVGGHQVNTQQTMGGSNANLLEEVRATKRDITTAHTTLTTHFNTFLSLAEQLETRLKEVESREGEVEKRENKLKGADQQYDERERNSLAREKKVEERERTMVDMEARWKETEKRMEANAAKLPTIIKLNISGTQFALAKETLLQHKGSLFEQMIVSNHPQQLSSGEIFIQRDAKFCHYVIRYFMYGTFQLPTNEVKRKAIEEEFKYFNIPLPTTPTSAPAPFTRLFLPRDSLSGSLVDEVKFGDKIKEWLPNRRFELLYKASVYVFPNHTTRGEERKHEYRSEEGNKQHNTSYSMMGGSNANLLEEVRATKRNITTAHTTFTTHFNTFLSLAEQLEIRLKEVEGREGEVEKRENKLKGADQQYDERERNSLAREKKVEERERTVADMEARWKETEKRMEANAAKLPTIIKLNISGTQFALAKETLLQHKGSLFKQMMVSNHSQQLPSSEIFIPRDPKFCQYVIRFLLYGTLRLPSNELKRKEIEQEFKYFSIPLPATPTPAPAPVAAPLPAPAPAPAPAPRLFLPRGSLSGSIIDELKYGDKIKEWLPNRKFELLYKASVDGFPASDFHKHCDNKGPTLTFIRSNNNHLFGGYTPLPWDCSTTYKTHTDMFIFTLRNPHNIPLTKYSLKPNTGYGIFCHSALGPVFGGGSDIAIHSDSHHNNSSYTNFPHDYIDTTGKGNNTFTGAKNFTTNEIEVYSVR